MKVELDIDELTKDKIAALEKKVKSLERRIETKDKHIREFKRRWKVSGKTVGEIRAAASDLCDLLEDADIVEYARYGNTC